MSYIVVVKAERAVVCTTIMSLNAPRLSVPDRSLIVHAYLQIVENSSQQRNVHLKPINPPGK